MQAAATRRMEKPVTPWVLISLMPARSRTSRIFLILTVNSASIPGKEPGPDHRRRTALHIHILLLMVSIFVFLLYVQSFPVSMHSAVTVSNFGGGRGTSVTAITFDALDLQKNLELFPDLAAGLNNSETFFRYDNK